MSQDLQASETRYHPVAKALHWLVTLLIAVQFGVAWAMPDIRPQTKLGRLISLHLTVGALIGLAAFARVSWRLRHRVPGAIATEPRWLRAGTRVSHATLYVLLLIVPLLGWAAASVRGWRVTLFPRLALPALLPRGSRSGFVAGDVPGLHAPGDRGPSYRRGPLPSAHLARPGAGANAPGQSIGGRDSR